MPQPPYSPVLDLADFFLFPKLKRPMKGKHFATIEEIKRKIETEAVGENEQRLSEVFRGLEKSLE